MFFRACGRSHTVAAIAGDMLVPCWRHFGEGGGNVTLRGAEVQRIAAQRTVARRRGVAQRSATQRCTAYRSAAQHRVAQRSAEQRRVAQLSANACVFRRALRARRGLLIRYVF